MKSMTTTKIMRTKNLNYIVNVYEKKTLDKFLEKIIPYVKNKSLKILGAL